MSEIFVLAAILKKIQSSLICSWISSIKDNPKLHHWQKQKDLNCLLDKFEMSTFSNSDFFLQTYAISKQIKIQWPATSHLEDFLQSFQMVMNFLCLRPIVKQKLAIQSALCRSYFYNLVPTHHRLPRQLVRLDPTAYLACHPIWRRILQLLTHKQRIHPYLGWKINFSATKCCFQKKVLFLMRRTVLSRAKVCRQYTSWFFYSRIIFKKTF